MATQGSAPRQWLRLPSMIRGPSAAAQPANPEPLAAPQPRPPMARAPFRPIGLPQPRPQPNQPQESTPPPPPPAANGVSSVSTSPIRRTSVPSSPVPKTSPPVTVLPATQSPPKPQVSAPSSSLPSSPSLKPSPASPSKPLASPMPTSPPKPAPTTFSVLNSPPKPEPTMTTATTRLPSPMPSPPTIKSVEKTPPQSPYNNPNAPPPPSPLILPSPQLKSKPEIEPTIPAESEEKTVLVQSNSTEKPKSWLNGTGNHKDFEKNHNHSSHSPHGNLELRQDIAKKEKGHFKKFSSDSDHEVCMRVITIAGENKGAFMEVIKSPLKHSFDGNSHNLHKTESNGAGWKSFSSSGGDEWKSKKDKNQKAKAADPSPPIGAFTNSNVQGVNNSIIFNSSCTHHDPGVHLSLSRNPSGNGFQVKDKSNGGHYS